MAEYQRRRPGQVTARTVQTGQPASAPPVSASPPPPPAVLPPAQPEPAVTPPPAPIPPATPIPAAPLIVTQQPQVTAPPPPPQLAPKPAPKKRRRRLIIAATGLLIVLAVAAAAAILWMRGGDAGTIVPLNPEYQAVVPAYKTFSNRYMSFQYKGEYLLQNLPAQGNDLTVYMFKADTQYQKQIAVSVSRTPDGWQSDAAYLLRKSQPSVYSSQPVSVDGSDGVVWTKSDGTEETVMLPHDGNMATLAFTIAAHGDDSGGGLDPEVRALLATFKWQP